MKAIIAFTRGGVADRVALALYGWRLAQATNRQFKYVWVAQPGCNCSFEALFVTRAFQVLPNLDFGTAPTVRRSGFARNRDKILSMDAPVVHLNGYYGHNFDDFEGVFTPSVGVAEAVARYRSERFSADVIGVHIRRTDKVRLGPPSDEHFFLATDSILGMRPAARIFLASDDPAVESTFRQRYGGRLLSYPVRTLSRHSSKGIIDAVIVLFLLRSTRTVVAGLYSGYSLLAAWNRPCVIVQTASSPMGIDWEGRRLQSPGSQTTSPTPLM